MTDLSLADRCVLVGSATRPKSWMTIARHAKMGAWSNPRGFRLYFEERRRLGRYPGYVLSPRGLARKAKLLRAQLAQGPE